MSHSVESLAKITNKFGIKMVSCYPKDYLLFYMDCGEMARISTYQLVRMGENNFPAWLIKRFERYCLLWETLNELYE